jgi:hypothetical protein
MASFTHHKPDVLQNTSPLSPSKPKLSMLLLNYVSVRIAAVTYNLMWKELCY